MANFELALANAVHVKNVPGRKGDVEDAMWLAELLEHGQASFVPKQTQEMRNLLRRRATLQKTLADANIKFDSVLPPRWLEAAAP
jgi:transposase